MPLSFFEKHSNKFKILAVFASGQFLFQVVNMITGFLILRWFTKEEYAKFTFMFGFQSMIGAIVEVGFSSCYMALMAPFNKDNLKLSEYYNAILFWRNLFFWLVLPVSSIIIYSITLDKGWNFWECLLLILPLPIGVFFQGVANLHGVVLLIRNEHKHLYFFNVMSGLGKLIVSGVLHFFNMLTSWSYLLVNTSMIVMNYIQYKSKSKLNIKTPKSKTAQKEVIDYIKPTIVGHFFYAFQSQFSILLISIFGQENSIAEFGALGRLGQLFVFMNTFNGFIVQPYFAKLSNEKVLRQTCILLAGFSLGLGGLTLIAFIRGDILLIILGEKYYNLTREVGWSVMASSISLIIVCIWTVFTSRKWVTYNIGIVNVIVFAIINIACCFIFDLSQTISVIKMSLFSTFGNLMVMVYFLTVNLWKINRTKGEKLPS